MVLKSWFHFIWWEVIKVFTVVEKNNENYYAKIKMSFPKQVNVYAVRDDKNGYPQFLIYENGEWKYVSAKHFRGQN